LFRSPTEVFPEGSGAAVATGDGSDETGGFFPTFSSGMPDPIRPADADSAFFPDAFFSEAAFDALFSLDPTREVFFWGEVARDAAPPPEVVRDELPLAGAVRVVFLPWVLLFFLAAFFATSDPVIP